MSYRSVLLFFGEKEPRQFIHQVHLNQTLHQSGQGASCALYSELTNERERETDGKRACACTLAVRMIEVVNISVSQSILELFFRGFDWYRERETKKRRINVRERERVGDWREKWQLIGIWVSSGKSSVIQQHLLLLPLKLL